jgi:hypothetical protein
VPGNPFDHNIAIGHDRDRRNIASRAIAQNSH